VGGCSVIGLLNNYLKKLTLPSLANHKLSHHLRAIDMNPSPSHVASLRMNFSQQSIIDIRITTSMYCEHMHMATY